MPDQDMRTEQGNQVNEGFSLTPLPEFQSASIETEAGRQILSNPGEVLNRLTDAINHDGDISQITVNLEGIDNPDEAEHYAASLTALAYAKAGGADEAEVEHALDNISLAVESSAQAGAESTPVQIESVFEGEDLKSSLTGDWDQFNRRIKRMAAPTLLSISLLLAGCSTPTPQATEMPTEAPIVETSEQSGSPDPTPSQGVEITPTQTNYEKQVAGSVIIESKKADGERQDSIVIKDADGLIDITVDVPSDPSVLSLIEQGIVQWSNEYRGFSYTEAGVTKVLRFRYTEGGVRKEVWNVILSQVDLTDKGLGIVTIESSDPQALTRLNTPINSPTFSANAADSLTGGLNAAWEGKNSAPIQEVIDQAKLRADSFKKIETGERLTDEDMPQYLHEEQISKNAGFSIELASQDDQNMLATREDPRVKVKFGWNDRAEGGRIIATMFLDDSSATPERIEAAISRMALSIVKWSVDASVTKIRARVLQSNVPYLDVNQNPNPGESPASINPEYAAMFAAAGLDEMTGLAISEPSIITIVTLTQ